MEKKFKYNFDQSNKILYKYYYGSITVEDISSSWDYAIANNLIPADTKGFILDYRKAHFNMKLEEYIDIVNYYKKNPEIFYGKKIAIITETPRDIVIPIKFGLKDEGYRSKPFVTSEAAVDWILTDYSLHG